MLNELKKEMSELKDPEKAKILMRFFKTGKGQYGEGDVFIGLMVPVQRKLAKKYKELQLKDLQVLITSKIHEERLIALFILIDHYQKSNEKVYVDFYLKNKNYVNNWDLVDLSAHKILGHYLLDKDRKLIYKLVKSDYLWDRRIAVLTTFAFIRDNDFKDSLRLCELLLKDKHDLMHKACGWMLREIGKRDVKVLEGFLKKYCKVMPRTMLRYSIERLSKEKRDFYMGRKKTV